MLVCLWIFLFAIYFLISIAAGYCYSYVPYAKLYEKESEYSHKEEIEIKKPSVYDLRNLDNKKQLSKYAEEIIGPSNVYFYLRYKISDYDDHTDAYSNKYSAIFVYSLSLLYLIFITSIEIIENKIAALIITISLCVLLSIIAHIICKKKLKITDVIDRKYYIDRNLSIEHLEKEFNYDKEEFDIDERTSFNNFLMTRHYIYLRSIIKTVETRNAIRKILFLDF